MISYKWDLLGWNYHAKWPTEWLLEGKVTPANHWLIPEPLYKPENTETIPMGQNSLRVPNKGIRCWNEPVPSTCCPVPELEPRGTDRGDGYRIIRKPSVSRPVFKID